MKEMTYIPILSICIPTYNRIERLLKTINTILQSDDNRFVITVSDNCSADGTYSKLEEIKDDRLVVHTLDKPVKAFQNYNNVIQIAKAQYVLHVLDKESFNVDYLSGFIDYLESKSPNFGLINYVSKDCEGETSIYKRGVESVLYGGGGGDTHPSGFFYRKSLYMTEYNRIKVFINGGNLWVLDLVSAGLGTQYDSIVYNHPLISYNKSGILEGKSKSPYTNKTIYWYGGMRVDTFKLFLKVVLGKDNNDTESILYAMLKKHTRIITFNQKFFSADKMRCEHYGLKTRFVGFFELLYWSYALIVAFKKECEGKIVLSNRKLIGVFLYGGYCSFIASYVHFKQFLKKLYDNVK